MQECFSLKIKGHIVLHIYKKHGSADQPCVPETTGLENGWTLPCFFNERELFFAWCSNLAARWMRLLRSARGQ